MKKMILLSLLFSNFAQADTLKELAYMVSRIENVEISCVENGKCTIKGKDTGEAERIMTEVVGPGLKKEGWNGHIRIEKKGT